ncbi:DUF3653 domain-containing protein [Photobacterium sp. DNB23_23_1]
MKIYAGRELGVLDEGWNGWKMNKEKLVIPGGWSVSPDRIIAGNALLEINADTDRKNMVKIIRVARQLKKLPRA